MTVKIITDSTSDLPPEYINKYGIKVVPVYVYFGKNEYRDGIDINPTQFYQQLASSPFHPSTSQPSVGDLFNAYNELADKGGSGIVSIHITSKISGTLSSAKRAAELVKNRIDVVTIDSCYNSLGLGLITIAAAKIANCCGTLQQVIDETMKAISQTDMYGIFDTLKYVVRGGRISKSKATVASIIGVKPMLKFSNGLVVQGGLARTYNKGLEKLISFVKNKKNILSMAVAHSAIPEEAVKFKNRLIGLTGYEDEVIVGELDPALGSHGGPGILLVALRSQ